MSHQSTGQTNAAVAVFTVTAFLPYVMAHILGSLHFYLSLNQKEDSQ